MNPEERWRLGEEPDAPDEEREALPDASHAPTVSNLSRDRLTRPVFVVTAEHLGWFAVVGYAVITRLMALGARPLDPGEARRALAAFGALGQAGVHASWTTILEGRIFAEVGAGDATSRIVVALSGLILVASAFPMRRCLGRAGALAFAAILTLSPSATYFSRTGSTAIASIAFMMIAIAIAESMRRRPGAIGAIGLGAAIGVGLSADPIGYAIAAAAVVALMFRGAYLALTIDHPRLRARVWWERRRAIVIVTTIVAIVVWAWLVTGLFTRSIPEAVRSDLSAAFDTQKIGWERGLHTFIPILGFYEFMISILAIAGASAIVAGQVRSGFAAWALVWAIMSVAVFLSVGGARPDAVVALLIPIAIPAAVAVEWMHQSARWDSMRYAIAAAALLTLYVQVLTSFAYPAPDTSEAPWSRHVLLFWSEPATAIQIRKECARAESSVSLGGASAMVPADAPAVQWYLRDFARADSAASANIVATIGAVTSGAVAGNPSAAQFGFEERWNPDFHRLTFYGALRYWLTMRAWSDVEIRDLEIAISRLREH